MDDLNKKELSILKKLKHKQSLKWISISFAFLSLYGFLFTELTSKSNIIINLLLLLSGCTYLLTLCLPFSIKFIYIFAYWYRILFLFTMIDFAFMLEKLKNSTNILYHKDKYIIYFTLFEYMFYIARLLFLFNIFIKHSKISTKIIKRNIVCNLSTGDPTAVKPSN